MDDWMVLCNMLRNNLSKIIRSRDIFAHILQLQIRTRRYMLKNQNLESNNSPPIKVPIPEKTLKSKLLQNKNLFRNDFRLFFSIVPFEHYLITWLCILIGWKIVTCSIFFVLGPNIRLYSVSPKIHNSTRWSLRGIIHPRRKK